MGKDTVCAQPSEAHHRSFDDQVINHKQSAHLLDPPTDPIDSYDDSNSDDHPHHFMLVSDARSEEENVEENYPATNLRQTKQRQGKSTQPNQSLMNVDTYTGRLSFAVLLASFLSSIVKHLCAFFDQSYWADGDIAT